MSKQGQQLPAGKAKKLFERFEAFRSTLPEAAQAAIPNSVCFSVDALQEYLSHVKEMLTGKGIAADEQTVTIFFGKHGDDVAEPHLREKCTAVLVASRSTSDDAGRVTAIDCCVRKEGEFPGPGESPADVSFNMGSLDP